MARWWAYERAFPHGRALKRGRRHNPRHYGASSGAKWPARLGHIRRRLIEAYRQHAAGQLSDGALDRLEAQFERIYEQARKHGDVSAYRNPPISPYDMRHLRHMLSTHRGPDADSLRHVIDVHAKDARKRARRRNPRDSYPKKSRRWRSYRATHAISRMMRHGVSGRAAGSARYRRRRR